MRFVYVVDDEGHIRTSLAHMLDKLGYAAWPFLNGTDFIEALPDLRPGCILLDIRMPGLSGTDAMELLARNGCDWPVIVMTGDADVPLAVQAMKLGAIEFIEKPFSADNIDISIKHGFHDIALRQLEQAVSNLMLRVATENVRKIAIDQHIRRVTHELGNVVGTYLIFQSTEMPRRNPIGWIVPS